MQDIPVLNWDRTPRAYFAVPDSKSLSLMSTKDRSAYEALVCSKCGGKILPGHKYTREGGLAHVNCPPKI